MDKVMIDNPTLENNQPTNKVLIIRMLAAADVCAIGLPAIRFFQQQLDDAEIHFLTFDKMAKVISNAEPKVHVHTLFAEQWPDDFFQAMEAFLGLAEQIIPQEYSQIINLDTAFMPCFLTRFLQDAGEPVSGNFLSMSIQDLLSKVQQQSLEPEYVNVTSAYLDSSFRGMYKWTTAWWQTSEVPEGGYPEFYLKQCCGFKMGELQASIQVQADKRLAKKAKSNKVIGLCFEHSEDGYLYPYAAQLKKLLQQQGYQVWSQSECLDDPLSLLKMLKASDLMICKAAGDRWFAHAVDCPVLLISGAAEPAILMPDFATDSVAPCVKHSTAPADQLIEHLPCNCDQAADLTESIQSIFEHFEQA